MNERMSDCTEKRIFIIGFGSIGQALIPLLLKYFKLSPTQIFIITKETSGSSIASQYEINLCIETITKQNYQELLGRRIQQGDFVVNLSVDVSSCDLIQLCQDKGALYLDTCTEPWKGGYTNNSLTPDLRTNYALRESVIRLKQANQPTAVITHGANPGLVSHFIKQALANMAADNGIAIEHTRTDAEYWAKLSHSLNIRAIHIAEHDSQVTKEIKQINEFVNTWSVDGFISECLQPAELGWGTHEQHLPSDGYYHASGPRCAIYLGKPGASVRVRTWVPSIGAVHGFLIPHAEAISLAQYLSLHESNGVVCYRPTVHYAYLPCPDAILSLDELAGKEWSIQEHKKLICNEIIGGADELGVLLLGNSKGAYWYGSQLSIHEARQIAPYNSATSLQVVMGIIAGMKWAYEHPNLGVIEPEEIDYQFVMNIVQSGLGKLGGYYTDWTPLQNREKLFTENLNWDDPWQFQNIRV